MAFSLGSYFLFYDEVPRREISSWIHFVFQTQLANPRSTKVRMVCTRVVVLVPRESLKATWTPRKWTRTAKNTWRRRSRTRTLYRSTPGSTAGIGTTKGKRKSLTTWKIHAPQGIPRRLCICWQDRPSFAFKLEPRCRHKTPPSHR